MELVLDEQGHAVLRNGKPVYKHPDGKEIEFDAAQAFGKIGQLTGENTSYKERFQTAESKLKEFEGITDPAAAIKAMETVGNLDMKKLIDAGSVETIKADISKSFQDKINEITKTFETNLAAERDKAISLEQALYEEKIGGKFASSKYISEALAIPADLARAKFGASFTMKDGKVVAIDSAGNEIYSRAKMGELADFEEAIETLVEQYPYKEHIKKGSGASGGGAHGSDTSSKNRAALAGLSPTERLAKARELGL